MPLYTDEDRLRWTFDGQKVLAPYRDANGWNPKGRAVRCVVVKVHGTKAEVKSADGKYHKLIDVLELFPDDGRINNRKDGK